MDQQTPRLVAERVADEPPRSFTIFGRSVPIPATPRMRRIVGIALVIGGVLGFLPILGFWMIPLGLLILSVDSPPIRRLRRRLEVRAGRWRQRRAGGSA